MASIVAIVGLLSLYFPKEMHTFLVYGTYIRLYQGIISLRLPNIFGKGALFSLTVAICGSHTAICASFVVYLPYISVKEPIFR